jgi:hypothetical protein
MEKLKLETLNEQEQYEVQGGEGAYPGMLWACLLLVIL